jgi:AcrR family transcriptional regulator
MIRKRLSREDSRELTTQRLLDAALKLFAKKGLDATSVEDIAEAAGYSRGAFYSNFESKEALFLEALRREQETFHEEYDLLRDDKITVEQIQKRTVALYSSMWRDNECFMLWTEARMLAVRDTRFRAKLNTLLVEKRAQIADFISYFYSRLSISPPLPPVNMAMAFMSLAEGVKLEMLSSPNDVTQPVAESLLSLFADAVMQVAVTKAKSARQRA